MNYLQNNRPFVVLLALFFTLGAFVIVGCQKDEVFESQATTEHAHDGHFHKEHALHQLEVNPQKVLVQQIVDGTLSLVESKTNKQLDSDLIKIPLTGARPFTGLAVKWQGANVEDFHVAVRSSEDNVQFGQWIDIHLDAHGEQRSDEGISQLIFLDKNARYIQWNVTVDATNSLKVNDLDLLEFHFINPGETPKHIKNQTQTPANKSVATCSKPSMVSRTSWGSICPQNSMCSGSIVTTTTTHIIIHHSETPNTSSDWAATVRSIQNYHVNTKGWSDIAYNFLIAPNGVMYEGRAGGDTSRGSHFCAKNTNTMGICVIGTYNTSQVNSSAISTLKNLLAWKCDKDGIDATGAATHSSSGLYLNRIAGHKDHSCTPTCPGAQLYGQLSTIRSQVKTMVDDCNNPDDGGGGGCLQREAVLHQKVARNISLFTSKELTATAKDVLTLYVENQAELNEIFESKDAQYEAVQTAVADFWAVNQSLIENGFGDTPTGVIEAQHIKAAKTVLSELAKVVTKPSLQDAIHDVYNSLDEMQGKALQDAIKSFDVQNNG